MKEPNHYTLNYNLNRKLSASNLHPTGLKQRPEEHSDATSKKN